MRISVSSRVAWSTQSSKPASAAEGETLSKLGEGPVSYPFNFRKPVYFEEQTEKYIIIKNVISNLKAYFSIYLFSVWCRVLPGYSVQVEVRGQGAGVKSPFPQLN